MATTTATNPTDTRMALTAFIAHCETRSELLEREGGLNSAIDFRITAARVYEFIKDYKKQSEQELLVAGLYEKRSEYFEKHEQTFHAATDMESAAALYHNNKDFKKATYCYAKAIALTDMNTDRTNKATKSVNSNLARLRNLSINSSLRIEST